MIELLSPVGDIDCLKAAVQNGADSVYFGANLFSARAFASNFDSEELKNAIQYAKLRGVKTNLTLNTLIKDSEFEDAFNLAKKAYEYGIDAIIVQDLGLAKTLIKSFPDLAIHASTQMSVHNLQGTLELQDLGFKRVVLSRELLANEIEYIKNNSNIELECFIHGALCISYSGQCLFSSMIGGRSGNRGKCAQPCRLPYTLIDDTNKELDSGYLLSTRDLCGLDYIPFLQKTGVTCLKIEGRMKDPTYVATVTRIYRKYIDLANSNEKFVIAESDKKELLQVFNRGNFSTGHLDSNPNRNLVFKEKQNNMGLFLGNVDHFNSNKGLITLKLKEQISIGDKISLEFEDGTYTISELMKKNTNIKSASPGEIVTIGRMKGNIKKGNNIYKISSKELNNIAFESIKCEQRKIDLNCTIVITKNKPIEINVTPANGIELYKDLKLKYKSNIIPDESINKPLDKETIIKQFSKTQSSLYNFKSINIKLDNNLFLTISSLNELRRTVLNQVESFAINNITRTLPKTTFTKLSTKKTNSNKTESTALLLNILHSKFDYSKLENVDKIYVPLKYFLNKNYTTILNILSKESNLYIYLPTIIKANYRNLMHSNIEKAISNYNIKGFVLSNLSNFLLLKDFNNKKFDFIANYTFNIFNKFTVNELKELGIDNFTISPELDRPTIEALCSNSNLPVELIVYGKTPLMNMNYCVLGKTNKCYPKCDAKCNSGRTFYLKDRLGMKFLVVPDNIQTVTTIYNSKTTSICSKDFSVNSVRIDILNENIEEINNIINIVKSGNRFEGKEYTNGNLNKEI